METIGEEESKMPGQTISAAEFESGEKLIQEAQVRLQVLKGIYRTQLGFDGVQNDPLPQPFE